MDRGRGEEERVPLKTKPADRHSRVPNYTAPHEEHQDAEQGVTCAFPEDLL